MKRIAQNWFKFALVIALLLISGPIFYYYVIFLPQKEQGRTTEFNACYLQCVKSKSGTTATLRLLGREDCVKICSPK